MFNVKGDTVFADITRFLEVCGMSAPGTVHAVWNDGDTTTSSDVTPLGSNSYGAGDANKTKNMRELESRLKDLLDAIEAVNKAGGGPEAKGFQTQVDELFSQMGDRFQAITAAANDVVRKFQEEGSAPLEESDQQPGEEQGGGMPGGAEQAGFGMPGGEEGGEDFGDFAALSSAQEEGETAPSGSTAPEEPKQKG